MQKLLDLRFDPVYSINTAVDYGTQNLLGLKLADFKVDGLADADRAKLVYLTHQLGLKDAKKFITNTMGESRAQYLLETQIGPDRAAARAEGNGDSYVKGHRDWLFDFIDDKIKVREKMCDPSKASAPRGVAAITVAIRPT